MSTRPSPKVERPKVKMPKNKKPSVTVKTKTGNFEGSGRACVAIYNVGQEEHTSLRMMSDRRHEGLEQGDQEERTEKGTHRENRTERKTVGI